MLREGRLIMEECSCMNYKLFWYGGMAHNTSANIQNRGPGATSLS